MPSISGTLGLPDMPVASTSCFGRRAISTPSCSKTTVHSLAALPATNDEYVRLGDVAELVGFEPALLEPCLPIRDGAVLDSFRSPVTLRLLVALKIVQRRQQCPGFVVSEPQVTQAPADRGLEP